MTYFSKVRKRRVFFVCEGFLRKIVKRVFLIALLSDQKRGKSQQGGLAPSSFRTSCGVHELVARAMRGKCMRQRAYNEVDNFVSSAISYYHACEHITRKSRADSCTHCLHARIIGLAGVSGACALTGI